MKRQLIIWEQGGPILGRDGHTDFRSETRYLEIAYKTQVAYFINIPGHLDNTNDIFLEGIVASEPYENPQRVKVIDVEEIEDWRLKKVIGREIMDIGGCEKGTTWRLEDNIIEKIKIDD